jgi:exosortase
MTSPPEPISEGAPTEASPRPNVFRRHWRLVALIVVGIGPFVPSIIAMQDFLLADNALGFTPFALVAAFYLFWLRSHSNDGPSTRDLFTDAFFLVPLVAISFFILFVTPARLSWYFWLNRMDLAALAPWAAATAIAFLGYQQVLKTWSAWAMLVLAWPYPLVLLQNLVNDAFVGVTSAVGGMAVRFLRLPYDIDPTDAQIFTTTHLPDGENFTLIVGKVCSGTASTIGFIVIGAALVLMTRGKASDRVRWLLVGVAFAFLANLVRVSVLLALATSVSRDVAVNQVHPILGLVLFTLVSILMLLLMRPLGLRFDPVPHGRRLLWGPGKGAGRGVAVLGATMAVLAVGIGGGVAQAQELNFIGIGEGAPAIAIDSPRGILPEIEAWELVHETEITWTDLFGRTSRGDVFAYREPGYEDGDPVVGVQTVVTEDRATLERYSLEQCIDFHRRTVLGRQAVDLGYGVTGYILHHTEDDLAASILYFVIPVNVDDEIFHARIALFGDVSAPTYIGDAPTIASQGTPGTIRMGQAVVSAMDGLPDASADPERAEIDRGLVALAVQMVDIMVQTGGPATQVPDATATP